jgi:phosphoribosylformylglycinamidine cyclo-ligase
MSSFYKEAGVNIEAGYEAVTRMKKHVQRTMRPEVMGGLGGFGGLFDISKTNIKEPVLVSGTDGVGTKLMIAFQMDKHDTIGIDAVAMCVNDIVVQGAEPLFFLDYIACGKAIPEKIEEIVKGISTGCEMAGCSLVGGETAEMPGLYNNEEYDLAGFTVGIVEKSKLINKNNIKNGDVLIGLASNGIHSNGYSLVRKVFSAENDFSLDQYYDRLSKTLGEELLTPTRIYVKPLLKLLEEINVHGMAHITGGGFYENIPRMLPEGLGTQIEYGTWDINAIFKMISEAGSIPEKEMFNVFNMGIGMVVAVSEGDVDQTIEILTNNGEKASVIGRIVEGEGVSFIGGNF